ncbi:MAG: DUF559 domain-containing protein [Rhodoblastus sp.]
MEAEGYAFLRFRNAELFENLDGVIETIWLKLRVLRPRLAADES